MLLGLRVEGRGIKTPYPNEEVQALLFQQVKGTSWKKGGFQELLEVQKVDLVVKRRWINMTCVRRKLRDKSGLGESLTKRELRKRIEGVPWHFPSQVAFWL